MSKGRKAGKAIGWTAAVGLIVGIALVIGFNWTGIKAMFGGATLYTQTDIENAYNDGYNDGITNEEKYQQQIDAFKKLIEANTKTINGLNEQIINLTGELDIAKGTIEQNAKIVEDLNTQIETLQENIASYETRIETLNARIEILTVEKTQLEKDASTNAEKIKTLQTTITSLTTERDTLKDTVNQHVATINTLTLTIETLNGQIIDKDESIATLNTQIEALQSSIRKYEQDVERYKQTIEELKKINTCVVTFTVDGVLVATQQVAKTESPTSFDDPANDAYVFHGWLLNGEAVDPFTYSITEDVNFIADISKFYTVTFEVEGLEPITQKVLGGTAAENVSIENTEEYVFNGWLLNGVSVDVSKYLINEDTTFTADISKYFTVTFMNGTEKLKSEKVLEGKKVTSVPEVQYNSDLQRFVGWKWNDSLVDLSIFIIEQDLTLVANFEAKEIAMKNFEAANALGIKEYYLYDSEDLNALSEIVNNGNSLAGYTIFLANDIDLKDKVFASIAPYTSGTLNQKYFSGNIDGQNYSIYNLESSTYGFIGNYQSQGNSYIKNLHLKNVNIETNDNVGGLIYSLTYKNSSLNFVNIENCSITGNIKSTSNGAAGLIYDAILSTNSTISRCWNGSTVVGYRSAAGLIGEIGSVGLSSNKDILTDCYNVGNIQTLYGSGFTEDFHASGLIGTFRDDSAKYVLSINNCYNSGNITGKTFVGGLIGLVFKGKLKLNNCFVLGSLEAEKNTDLTMLRIGGLIGTKGSKSSEVSINNCFVNVNASAYLDAVVGFVRKSDGSGGSTSDTAKSTFGTCVNTYYGDGLQTLIKTAKQDVAINSDSFKNIEMPVYSTWNFESVWKINVGELPTFQEVA